ncbi:putative zinc ribbon protein, partial [Escherichia coli]
GCPLTLQRGNDGQPPWFEHDQMTVAEKILLRCTWLDPAEKEARRLHLQGMTVPDYTVKVRKWFCVMCDEDYEGEKCCPRCGTGYTAGRGGGRRCRRKMPGLIIRYRGCNGCLRSSLR